MRVVGGRPLTGNGGVPPALPLPSEPPLWHAQHCGSATDLKPDPRADRRRSAVRARGADKVAMYGRYRANRTNARRDGAVAHLSCDEALAGLWGRGIREGRLAITGDTRAYTTNGISKQTYFQTLCRATASLPINRPVTHRMFD